MSAFALNIAHPGPVFGGKANVRGSVAVESSDEDVIAEDVKLGNIP